MTMPLGSEHAARCTYSKDRQLCDVPPQCTDRLSVNLATICNEIPNIERV
jgi:hypothetical protein